jgi:hypothetical protein
VVLYAVQWAEGCSSEASRGASSPHEPLHGPSWDEHFQRLDADSVWAFPTVLISVLALVVPLSTATAAAPAPDPTVTFSVVDADGRPAGSGKIKLVNTDSLMRDYPGTATVKAGKAKVKLPKGHYCALGVAGSRPAASRVTRIVPITDFTVWAWTTAGSAWSGPACPPRWSRA